MEKKMENETLNPLPSNDIDYDGIYQYLMRLLVSNGEPSSALHYLEVLHKREQHCGVQFKFELNQKVRTILGDTGVVDMLGIDDGGVKYYVKKVTGSDWFKGDQLVISSDTGGPETR